MYGLIDCNNFFVSCERVFRPDLIGKPVVVLSNNDGCVVSRSNEAKRLGIKMAVPAFEIKELIEKKSVMAFSSNYPLYADMSARIMSTIAEMVPGLEVYSIDEAFVNLNGIADLEKFSQHLVDKIYKSTGVPVSLGIAQTKTLAKMASEFAKKYKKYNRVCMIDNDEKRIKALKLTEIKNVWGVGRKLSKKLEYNGIFTAYDLAAETKDKVRGLMTVVGERMWKELNGSACIGLGERFEGKKQICNSRSFEKMLNDYADLAQAIAYHATNCAKQLRKQKSCAVSLMVFIQTNRFREDLAQYRQNSFIQLPVASSDSLEIVSYSLQALRKIFVKGFLYKRAGVVVTEIVPCSSVQRDLFDKKDHERSEKLMKAIDEINNMYREPKVKLAVTELGRNWKLKREMLSKCYTTNIKDIIKVQAK